MKNEKVRKLTKRLEACVPKIVKSLRVATSSNMPGIELNFSQELVMISLSYNNYKNMSELSETTGVNITALTGVVDSLVKKNLLNRKIDINDRRKVIVFSVSKGISIGEQLKTNRLKHMEHVVKSLNINERDIIVDGFEKIVEILYNKIH